MEVEMEEVLLQVQDNQQLREVREQQTLEVAVEVVVQVVQDQQYPLKVEEETAVLV
jgi:hypothetical protein